MNLPAPLRVLVVGCGNMGASHAVAYSRMPAVRICGIVSRGDSKVKLDERLGGGHPLFDDYAEALEKTSPDAVCISTYPDTHEAYAVMAFEKGCHVFMEKPIADSVAGAQRVADAAARSGKKLVVGYILRHHPSWIRFIEEARQLGKPLVMRMNLNQQSHGYMWDVHRNLMASLSPIVDCAVHYIDVMCQMVRSRPVKVHAIGARLTPDIPDWNYNYGQLQIRFEDGSVGWYEAGWGPMMSEVAFFVKDVVGPKGCVSIVADKAAAEGQSANVNAHCQTQALRFHPAELGPDGKFRRRDEIIRLEDEPDHDGLCLREQQYFLQAIRENLDLTSHMDDAIQSMRIVAAADESFRTGRTIDL